MIALLVHLALSAVAAGPEAPTDAPERVLVVSSRAFDGPYREALDGLVHTLVTPSSRVRVTAMTLAELGQGPEPFAVAVARVEPRLVVTLGHAAFTTALVASHGRPIVAGLVAGPDEFAGRDDVTGVHMTFPLGEQLRVLRRMLPRAEDVGIVYDERRGVSLVNDATAAAAAAGLRLVHRSVTAAREIPRALASLKGAVSVLLGLVDPLVYTQETAREFLLFSFRNRVPLVGASPSWVEAGALYGLAWDHGDIGRQLGEMAVAVLAGRAPAAVPVQAPRRFDLIINGRTAEQLEITIPAELRSTATQILWR